jgi:hypothetical protein
MNIQEEIEKYQAAKNEIELIKGHFKLAGDYLYKKVEEFKIKIGVREDYNTPRSLPPFFYHKNFHKILGFNSNLDSVLFCSYVRGYGGDADEYPESEIPLKLFDDYYNNRAELDKYFDEILIAINKRIEDEKLASERARESAEKAKFLELKKKFEGV